LGSIEVGLIVELHLEEEEEQEDLMAPGLHIGEMVVEFVVLEAMEEVVFLVKTNVGGTQCYSPYFEWFQLFL
jgi:hypothetical protein